MDDNKGIEITIAESSISCKNGENFSQTYSLDDFRELGVGYIRNFGYLLALALFRKIPRDEDFKNRSDSYNTERELFSSVLTSAVPITILDEATGAGVVQCLPVELCDLYKLCNPRLLGECFVWLRDLRSKRERFNLIYNHLPLTESLNGLIEDGIEVVINARIVSMGLYMNRPQSRFKHLIKIDTNGAECPMTTRLTLIHELLHANGFSINRAQNDEKERFWNSIEEKYRIKYLEYFVDYEATRIFREHPELVIPFQDIVAARNAKDLLVVDNPRIRLIQD